MVRKVGIAVICGMLFFSLSLPSAFSASNIPDSGCTKVGITAKSGLSVVKCVKVGSKLVWKMISISRVISPTDNAAMKLVQAARAKALADKNAARRAAADRSANKKAATKNATSTPKPFTPEIENKLNGFLPIQTEDYRIDYDYNRTTKQYIYTVTLYAIINRPDQNAVYLRQLKQFKQEALDYISSHGGGTSKLPIQYLPPVATNL